MYASKPYRQAVELQRRIMSESASAQGLALANLAKAFGTLELLKLRLRMKPAPKPVDVNAKKQSKAQPISPVDPSQA